MAHGMMDAALFLSNVAQLKSIFDGDVASNSKAKVGIAMIVLSLLLQFSIGILFIMILDIEGCLVQLKQIGTTGGLVPNPTGGNNDPKIKLARRARRINTAIMFFILAILGINLIINGLNLSK